MNTTGQRCAQSITRAFGNLRLRLATPNPYTAMVILIPFLTAALLALFVGLETSSRYKSGIEPFYYPASKSNDHKLWMSVGLKDGRVMIRTSTDSQFSWSASGPTEDEYRSFEEHMQNWTKNHLKSLIVAGQLSADSNTAAIAIDQRLTFHHVRPVIYALAASGISKYGFETKLPNKRGL